MAVYGPKKWGTKNACPQCYRALGELPRNVNSFSIKVSDQKLCLPEFGLPFLFFSNFTPTSDVFSKTFYFGSGFQMAYSKIYS